MADPARQTPTYKDHSIRWDGEDWERILQAADLLNEQQHLDLTPTSIIRSATRRYLDEMLPTKVG